MAIKLLSADLINQIAAGEVIERPASVVKELLENSIDAQAQDIKISLKQAGRELIQISDDGIGIAKADLALALQTHATSKLQSLEDLKHIASLGFRGEALASIAAIARLKLISCQQQATHAWQINNSHNQVEPVSHAPGTTIQVSDLFYRTPVRRKFLRSDNTEFEHILQVVKRLALVNFNISWQVIHNEKIVLTTPACQSEIQQQQRLGKICGKNFSKHAQPFLYESNGYRLSGWLGDPEYARNSNDLQYLYINGRMVRDRLLNHAIRQAYADLLFSGKQAAYVIYIECDPQLVDVNVHPTKHEVRFLEPRLVHDFIFNRLYKQLHKTQSINTDFVSYSHSNTTLPATTGYTSKKPLFPALAVTDTKTAINYMEQQDIRFIAAIYQEYLLYEYQGQLYVLAKALAWQHILQTHWQSQLAQNNIKQQTLIMPQTLKLRDQALGKKIAEFCQLGFTIREIGEQEWALDSIPAIFSQVRDWGKIFMQLRADHSIESQMVLLSSQQMLTYTDNRNSVLSEFIQQYVQVGHPAIQLISQQQLAALFQDSTLPLVSNHLTTTNH